MNRIWIAATIVLAAATARADSSVPPATGKRPEVAWQSDPKAAASDAQRRGKSLLLLYCAEWAMPCAEMKWKVFRDPEVVALIRSRFVPVYIDVTDDQNPISEKLRKEHRAETVPMLIVFDGKGREVWRLDHYATADEVRQRLSSIK